VLAQDGDGLRADQAGAADDDGLHHLPSLVDDWKSLAHIPQMGTRPSCISDVTASCGCP
jgi:hypothetical protein